eukprot:3785699-Amphidinium_carterae.2
MLFDSLTLSRKLKAVGSSNWACDRGLSSSQREYAADDAFFQLYLFGKLIDKHPSSSSHITQAYAAWKATEPSLTRMVERVDNAVFKKHASAQQGAAQVDALAHLDDTPVASCQALGSKGVTNLNDISAFDSDIPFAAESRAWSKYWLPQAESGQVQSCRLIATESIALAFLAHSQSRPRLSRTCSAGSRRTAQSMFASGMTMIHRTQVSM